MKEILALSDMRLQIYLDHIVVPSQHIPETQNAFHFEMLGSEILIQPLQVDDWAPSLSFLGTTNKGLKKASFFTIGSTASLHNRSCPSSSRAALCSIKMINSVGSEQKPEEVSETPSDSP